MTAAKTNAFGSLAVRTYLEHGLDVVRHGHAVPVSQGQDLVVIEHGVEVFDPDGVHGTVRDDPSVVRVLPVVVLGPHRREDACCIRRMQCVWCPGVSNLRWLGWPPPWQRPRWIQNILKIALFP